MITLNIIIQHITMFLKGYRKGLTSSDMPSNVDLDAMPSPMRRGAISHATYRKVWYKRKNGQLIKHEILTR